MNIVDATWEKRNLGVTTQEITVGDNDAIETLKSGIQDLSAEYQVIKIPAGKVDLMWTVEDLGFHFVETSVHVVHDLKNISLSPMLERMNQSIGFEVMGKDDISQMLSEIKKGLFYTDRVYLDPYFTEEQAANRYIGWIGDEIERGTEIFKYTYREQAIGFCTFKQTEKDIYYPFLAGVYPEFRNKPFGAIYTLKPLFEAKKRGGKMVSTYISTNNANATRMHAECGFKFNEITYVYVKHCIDS